MGPGLPIKWDNAGEKPLSMAGEDPRWVMKAMRMLKTLGDPGYKWYWWGPEKG